MEIPIFPLSTVLFPGGRLPLRIFEPRYVEMTKACIRDNTVFGVALIVGGFEVGVPAIPASIGCTARIIDWDVPNPGLFTLTTQGETRFRLRDRRVQANGLIVGTVELLEPPDPIGVPERFEPLQRLLADLIHEIGADHFSQRADHDDAAWLAGRLAELLPVPPERKLRLLEASEPLAMLEDIEDLLRELRSPDGSPNDD